jgi:SAM-dependent methyltransferase
MRLRRAVAGTISAVIVSMALSSAGSMQAQAQKEQQFEPQVGQAGKDVVWVPTPPVLVEKMLDMAKVTPEDFVVDLGSGDGRNVIAAAKRGARALGVEYNPDMVELAKRNAASQGVSEKATFVQGDMFEADFSKATVLALFLLPDNMMRLRDKFVNLRPGTRIVSNTFSIDDWQPDASERVETDCQSWCTSLLWIVPARVAGTWRLAQGDLTLTQDYQMVTGTLASAGTPAPLTNGRLVGEQITFRAGGAEYSGRVAGDVMEGSVKGADGNKTWRATRVRR